MKLNRKPYGLYEHRNSGMRITYHFGYMQPFRMFLNADLVVEGQVLTITTTSRKTRANSSALRLETMAKVKITEVTRGTNFEQGFYRSSIYGNFSSTDYGPYMIMNSGEKRYTSQGSMFRYFLTPMISLETEDDFGFSYLNFTHDAHTEKINRKNKQNDYSKIIIKEVP